MKKLFLLPTLAVALLVTAPATAHVVLDQASANSGAYFKARFGVPHGCDGSATTAISITIPEGVIAVKPQPKPGWKITIETASYPKAYTMHGKKVSEGVTRVTWTGGPLPDAYFDEFTFNSKLPDDPEVMKLFFPVLQTCEKGSIAWDQIATPDMDPHSLPHPAASLTIIHGDGSHGHHHH